MRLKFFFLLIGIILLICFQPVKAGGEINSVKYTISGYVKDADNGEAMVGATVLAKEIKSGTSVNQFGFYSLSLPEGDYTLSYTFIGYTIVEKFIHLRSNLTINVDLTQETKTIDEVKIIAQRSNRNVQDPEMGTVNLQMKSIRQIPALMGEVDILKAIQMLPGVLPASEGSSGFVVRGGSVDQNEILLDGAPLYNASHLMGFLSVFNNDAISDVTLYKGDIPPIFGGRLSSVLEVRMKEGNNKRFSGTGGIGLIDSRLTLEGPLGNKKTSFLISGRRTYMDIFFPLFKDTSLKKAVLYFYDFNFKLNNQINENNRLFLSAYLGQDNFGQKGSTSAGFGNKTVSIRWNHVYTQKLFSNLTGVFSKYSYNLTMAFGGANYIWNSSIQDLGIKMDFYYFVNPQSEITYGLSSTYHTIIPCDASEQNAFAINPVQYPNNHELDHALYLSNQEKIGDQIIFKYGVRWSIFQNIGSGTIYSFDANYNVIDTTNYSSGKIFHTYQGLEPRFGFTYVWNDESSIKGSYSRTYQYLQLASNSSGGMPLDVWFPADPNVKPQRADQYSLGYFRNFNNNALETSFETFYKQMNDVIDFEDNAKLLLNPFMEGQIRVGKAHAYGAELLVRKNEGKLTGWVSYTYSRSIRQIPGINLGNPYPSPYDKPNSIDVILNYAFSERKSFSANWIYLTGAPMTVPVAQISYGNVIIPEYGPRNGGRMRAYNRMDLSYSAKCKVKPGRRWQGEWVFSIYNVYARHNDWIINFVSYKNDQSENSIYAERMYLPFICLPSITYNFKF